MRTNDSSVRPTRPPTRSSARPRGSQRLATGLAACVALVVADVACGTSPASSQGERTGSTAAALTNPPTQLQSFQTGQGTTRPVVAVGRDYVLLTDTTNVRAFKREAADGLGTISSIWGSDLPSGTPYSSTLVDIFHEQIPIYNAQVQSWNSMYQGQVANPVQPCNYADSSYMDVKTPTPALTNGCATTSYDGDTIYDEYSGHFFVLTKLRRSVWTCDTNGNPGTPGGTGWWDGTPGDPCNDSPAGYALGVSARPFMVAVTKCNSVGTDCENPNNGWNTYTLVQTHADWGQIMVARGLAMVSGRDDHAVEGFNPAGMLWGFSANSLITGADYQTPNQRFVPAPGFQTVADDFQTTDGLSLLMLVKLHSPTSADFPMVVTQDGGNLAAYNLVPTDPAYVQAVQADPLSPTLWDLSPWISSIAVSGEATIPLPAGLTQQFNAHPVWSANATGPGTGGALYWSFVNGSQGVSAFRWPMTPAPLARLQPPGSTFGTLASQGFVQWNVGVGVDFPVLEHNEISGDTVLLFDTFTGSTSAPFETSQYAVAGPTDTAFSAPVTIKQASGTGNTLASVGGTVDIVSNVSDPIRPQVFMTSVASNASDGFDQRMTSVQLNDPPVTPPPPALQLPLGMNGDIVVPFPGWASAPTNVSPPLPTCTAGGDLGAPSLLTVTAQGVTVAVSMPWTAPVNTPLVEGVSCSNGVSVAVPVSAQLYPDCTATYGCDGSGSATNKVTCGLLVNDFTLMRSSTTGCPGQSPCLLPDTNAVQHDPYTWFDYSPAVPGTTIEYVVDEQLSSGPRPISPPFTSTVTSIDCACWTTTVCQLPNGQQIYPTVHSPPNWCSSRGGRLVSKRSCPN